MNVSEPLLTIIKSKIKFDVFPENTFRISNIYQPLFHRNTTFLVALESKNYFDCAIQSKYYFSCR